MKSLLFIITFAACLTWATAGESAALSAQADGEREIFVPSDRRVFAATGIEFLLANVVFTYALSWQYIDVWPRLFIAIQIRIPLGAPVNWPLLTRTLTSKNSYMMACLLALILPAGILGMFGFFAT